MVMKVELLYSKSCQKSNQIQIQITSHHFDHGAEKRFHGSIGFKDRVEREELLIVVRVKV